MLKCNIDSSPFILILLVVVDFFLMVTTSMFGVCALWRARKVKKVSTAFAVTHIILHFFFVADVISSIIVFVKLRRKDRNTIDQEL